MKDKVVSDQLEELGKQLDIVDAELRKHMAQLKWARVTIAVEMSVLFCFGLIVGYAMGVLLP